MGDPLPPDPYLALNIPRDATDSTIKSAYRKAALRCHPDKAKDRGDEFHRIQQAYEILGDPVKRARYDDEVRLLKLRRDLFQGRSGASDGRNATFDLRTTPLTSPIFTSTRIYEERRPSYGRVFEEDTIYDGYFDTQHSSRASSRKYDGYEASTRRPPLKSSSRSEDKRTPKTDNSKAKEKDIRSSQKKKHEKEIHNLRGRKQPFVENDSDDSDDGRYASMPRSSYPEKERKREPRGEEDDFVDDRTRKINAQVSDVQDYINRSRASGGLVDSPGLDGHTSSYRHEYHFEVRLGSKDGRPSMVRRSSTRPQTAESSPSSRRDRDRRGSTPPEIVGSLSHDRGPPPLSASYSSPGSIKIPSLEKKSRRHDQEPEVNPRVLQRAATMPVGRSAESSSRTPNRRGDPTPTPNVSSNLRYAENNDSGYSTSSTSTTPPPPPASKTYYRYGNDYNKVELGERPDNVDAPPTVIREPARSTPDTRRSSYTLSPDIEVPSTSSRRPGFSRTDSSKHWIPEISRRASAPITSPKSQTGGLRDERGFLFGEVRTASPENIWSPEPSQSRRGSNRDPDVSRVPVDVPIREQKRYQHEDVHFSHFKGFSSSTSASKERERSSGESERKVPSMKMATGRRKPSEDPVMRKLTRANAHMQDSERERQAAGRRVSAA